MVRLRFYSALFAVAVALAAAMPAEATKRVALVMGNSAYVNAPPLPNPRNDAQAMSATLTDLGFEVITGLDLDREGMEDAVDRFGKAAEEAELALVFYAGHGIQVAGENYALPVDARLRSERDLRRAVPLSWLVAEAGRANRLGLVILDACRNNPLAEEMKRRMGATRAFAVGRGLARLEDAPTNTLIAYATSADATAEDGVTQNSPYTTALLEHIRTPGLEVRQLFGRVRDTVLSETNGGQTPFTYGSLGGDAIYLGPPPDVATLPAPTAPNTLQPVVPIQPPRVDESLIEIEFWTSIRTSNEPAYFEAYLTRFPNGTFAALAEIRLQKLREAETAALTPAPAPIPTLTPEPPAIPVDEMSATYWVVKRSNVRAGPSTNFDKVGGLDAGTPISVTGKVRGENWYRVALLGGTVGYIYGGLIQLAAPATPAPMPAPTTAGTPHDIYPNVVWNAEDQLEPAPGYEWASDDPDSYDVMLVAPGTPHDTYPNVVWDADGQLQPTSGYQWLSDDPDSYDVMRVYSGTPHYKYPNVVWDADGQLLPAPGYAWVTDDPGDFRVQPN
jgi:uncharacterized caspase-like protein/uncharacterized protein YraI